MSEECRHRFAMNKGGAWHKILGLALECLKCGGKAYHVHGLVRRVEDGELRSD